MASALTVMYAIVGLALGGSVGYALGRRAVDDRRLFWLSAVSLVVVCAIADYVGFTMGPGWLRIGSLCAMAGAITGLKYGGLPEVRVWEAPPQSGGRSPEPEDATIPEDAATR